MSRTFTLQMVRHGLSEANVTNAVAGWSDVDLCSRGVAELLDIRRKTRFSTTDSYFSSDLLRCRRTFEILFPEQIGRVSYESRFREINFHSFDGHSFPSSSELKRYLYMWSKGEGCADEETVFEMMDRAERTIDSFIEERLSLAEASSTIVCHAGFIRCLMMRKRGLPPTDFVDIPVPNGRGYLFQLCRAGAGWEITGLRLIE